MAYETENLSLFCYDEIIDSDQVFSFQQALNDNWVKIDNDSKASWNNLADLWDEVHNLWTSVNGKIGATLSKGSLNQASWGYMTFTNGFIIQWVKLNVPAGTQTYGLPLTFPHYATGIGCANTLLWTDSMCNSYVGVPNLGQYQINTGSPYTEAFTAIFIGY